MERIKSILQSVYPFLEGTDLEALLADARYISLGHKDSIISEGDRIESLYFILEGMVRGYFISNSGEERTIILRPTRTFFSPPGVLEGAANSKYAFEAIQETNLVEIPLSSFISLSQTRLGISRLHVEMLTENLQTVFFRVELLAGMSPEQRYEILLKERPELFQKSYHKYVANYLGITPNSLSRIIKRRSQKV